MSRAKGIAIAVASETRKALTGIYVEAFVRGFAHGRVRSLGIWRNQGETGYPAGGYALLGTLMASSVLLLMALALTMFARLYSVDSAAMGAARLASFHCALTLQGCTGVVGVTDGVDPLTVSLAAGPTSRAATPFWHDHKQRHPWLRAESASLEASTPSFDAIDGLLGSKRIGQAAVEIISELAGPARFGLRLREGLYRQQVAVPVWQQAEARESPDLLDGFGLTVRAQHAVLADTWGARADLGSEHDTTEQRVARGSTPLRLVERTTEAAYRPTEAFMTLMHGLRLDADPKPLTAHQLAVDLIPDDREIP